MRRGTRALKTFSAIHHSESWRTHPNDTANIEEKENTALSGALQQVGWFGLCLLHYNPLWGESPESLQQPNPTVPALDLNALSLAVV